MRLVLLVHPPSLGSASMPRFAEMIRRGMVARGHQVESWTSRERLGRLPVRSAFVRKWLGYADQFLFYPRELRQRISQQSGDTLFVVTDQALGMWVPCFAHRPHVIHCHDFMALRSALGEFPENPTGWTGRQYQQLIQKGFSQGKAFISVSGKTRDDLHRFLPQPPQISEVVHNGLNYPFRAMELAERLALLQKVGVKISEPGHVLHVGGNQWYKNRPGVLKIYRAYVAAHSGHEPGSLNPAFSPAGREGVRRTDEGDRGLKTRNFVGENSQPAALWMIGSPPTAELLNLAASISAPGKVHFLSGLSNEQVNAAYAHARALLFSSLEEGFGWPIVEAMASGCPVITTDLAPMTEVAGAAARLIPRMPTDVSRQEIWATAAAEVLNEVVSLDETDRANFLAKGKLNAARFDAETVLDAYEKIYARAIWASPLRGGEGWGEGWASNTDLV